MMEKTKLIFRFDVMCGYKHYINFKRDFSGALAVFKKYILPVCVNISVDVNNDWLVLIFQYNSNMEDYLAILQDEWDTLTKWLDKEEIQYAYPTQYDDWSMIIPIDDFVEWAIKYTKGGKND